MSDIATKLTYLNETKSQLKDIINYGLPTENQITNETTFRNYVKGIFEAFIESLKDSTALYTNLPKISGNGTQITLNDTANVPMRITLKASELSQDGTPTPSSPQDIHTISGDNSVVVEGKNLFELINTTKATITTTDNKTFSYIPTVAGENNYSINGQANTSYTFKTNISASSSADVYMYFMYSDGTAEIIGSLTGSGALSKTINKTSNSSKTLNGISLRFYDIPNKKYYTFEEPQLEKGSTATTYSPYTSNTQTISLGNTEYCKIGDYEDKFIRNSGKNLFDISVATSGPLFTKTDNVFISNSLNAYDVPLIKLNNPINIKNGQDYYISYDIKLESGDLKNLNYFGRLSAGAALNTTTNFGSLVRSFTISNQYQRVMWKTTATSDFIANYLFMQTASPLTTPQVISIKNIQIATEDVEYEPYGTNQWYLKKNIGKVVLDGSESDWWKQNNQYRHYIGNAPYEAGTKCNYFKKGYTDNEYWFYAANYVAFTYTDTTTVADWKTWLSTHNTIVYYRLATPTYILLNDTLQEQLNNIYEKLLSYKDATNISQVNNDLPFVLGVSAIQDLE